VVSVCVSHSFIDAASTHVLHVACAQGALSGSLQRAFIRSYIHTVRETKARDGRWKRAKNWYKRLNEGRQAHCFDHVHQLYPGHEHQIPDESGQIALINGCCYWTGAAESRDASCTY